jgi:hypothetical protein
LICFCPSYAPYVGGFVLIEAFEPIAGRGCFLYDDPSRRLILKFKHGDTLHLNPLFVCFL